MPLCISDDMVTKNKFLRIYSLYFSDRNASETRKPKIYGENDLAQFLTNGDHLAQRSSCDH